MTETKRCCDECRGISFGENICWRKNCKCHTPVSEPTPPPNSIRVSDKDGNMSWVAPPPTDGWKEELGDFVIINELYLRGVNVTKLSAFIESLLAEQKALHDKHCKEQYDLGHAHGVEIERACVVEVLEELRIGIGGTFSNEYVMGHNTAISKAQRHYQSSL